MPSLLSSTPPATTIQLESEPAGADARTSVGPGCRTPCSVGVPTTKDFTVTFTLAGFQPLTVPVAPVPPTDPRDVGQGVRFDPSPVFAQLEPAPPPPTKGKKRAAPKAAKTSAVPKEQ